MKKIILKWIFGVIAALLVLLVAGGWWLFGTLITAANSIEKLEEGLYSMEYVGDYGFNEPRAARPATAKWQIIW